MFAVSSFFLFATLKNSLLLNSLYRFYRIDSVGFHRIPYKFRIEISLWFVHWALIELPDGCHPLDDRKNLPTFEWNSESDIQLLTNQLFVWPSRFSPEGLIFQVCRFSIKISSSKSVAFYSLWNSRNQLAAHPTRGVILELRRPATYDQTHKVSQLINW